MTQILIVDDDPEVQTTLSRMLRSLGYGVATCDDPRQALDALASTNCQAVLLDLILPHRSGIELAMEIRRRFPEVKVLAMSGGGRTDNTELLKLAAELGAQGTISKPIRLNALKEFLDGQGLAASPTS